MDVPIRSIGSGSGPILAFFLLIGIGNFERPKATCNICNTAVSRSCIKYYSFDTAYAKQTLKEYVFTQQYRQGHGSSKHSQILSKEKRNILDTATCVQILQSR